MNSNRRLWASGDELAEGFRSSVLSFGGSLPADTRTLFVPATKDEHTVALLEIDTQGNAWELLHGQLGWAIPSPDGRHLAFMQVAGENNVWMLEDF